MILDVDISRDARAPWHARRAVERLGDRIDPEIAPDVMLLVSELVTNSVKYGGAGPVRLEVRERDGRLRAEIIDQGVGFTPIERDGDLDRVGGWGLHLVESIATRWGVQGGRRTRVWFEIDS